MQKHSFFIAHIENVVSELKQRIKELKEGTAYVSEVEQTNDAE